MSETLRRVQTLVLAGDYLVSRHGYDELDKDGIVAADAFAGVASAVVVEDYPDRMRGPSVLALQYDGANRPIHVLWGIPAGQRRPAVLITAYRPDPNLWDDDFRRRQSP